VREAAAAVREGPGGENRLVAWIVPESGRSPTPAELRAWVGDSLPEYMVPAAVHMVAEMPLGSTGKVDRRALPEGKESGQPTGTGPRAVVPPRDLVELALVRIWEEVLEVRPLGVEDNFFESGGHSLLAVRLMVRIRERFGRELPLAILFQTGTVERLAAVLRRGGVSPRGALVPIQEQDVNSTSRPFFCVHPAGGNVLCYVDLARALGPAQPFYGLQYPDPEETGGRPLAGLEEMAAHYVAAVRQVQPSGPYRLGGWSLGGLIAFEMARQIAAADGPEAVELAALIDPPDARADLSWGEREEAELLAWFARDLAAMQGQDVQVSADELRAIPAGERLARMLESAREAGLLPPEVDLDEARHLFDVFQGVQGALRGSPVQAGPVRATLFQAGEQLPEGMTDPTRGWGDLALGGIEVEALPADHYSVVRAPHVEALASRLRDRLRPEEPV
jgi:thioesterase domain-containing protein/acyl carrier protein